MLEYLAGVTLLTITLIFLYYALRIMLSKGVFKNWLKGNVALVLILCVCSLVIIGLEMQSYNDSRHGKLIATINIEQTSYQVFNLEVIWPDGTIDGYLIKGDQWQLDARLIIWSGWFETFGLDAIYRFERLSGRYYSVNDELEKPRTVYALNKYEGLIDVWAWINQNAWLPGVNAMYGAGVYMPLGDNISYGVYVRDNSLLTLSVESSH